MIFKTQGLRMAVDVINLTAEKAPNFIDITDKITEILGKSDITNGLVVVFSRHTTAAIKINENEPELIKDMEMFLTRLSPPDADYCHNNFEVRTVNMEEDECPNGHAHCQHLLLSASESIPVIDGRLQLGVWQRVFFVELDRPRERQVLVQVMGE